VTKYLGKATLGRKDLFVIQLQRQNIMVAGMYSKVGCSFTGGQRKISTQETF
jgi:hypothetical protein